MLADGKRQSAPGERLAHAGGTPAVHEDGASG